MDNLSFYISLNEILDKWLDNRFDNFKAIDRLNIISMKVSQRLSKIKKELEENE